MNTLASTHPPAVAGTVLDEQMPVYDVVLTEHTVVGAPLDVAYRAARELDFLTIRAPLVTALMTARAWPSRLRGRPVEAPAALRLATDPGVLPGWLSLGETPGRELAFGATGKF